MYAYPVHVCYQSRYRPHVIGDDTKQAKATAKCMEYLTRLFCPSTGKKLPCYNLVVLIATFGNTRHEIPIDIRLWLPKQHPEHISKPQMMKAMIEALKAEAEKRGISQWVCISVAMLHISVPTPS